MNLRPGSPFTEQPAHPAECLFTDQVRRPAMNLVTALVAKFPSVFI